MKTRFLQCFTTKLLLAIALMTVLVFPGCTSQMPVITSFEIMPAIIAPGQSAAINWNVTGASSVIIDKIGVISTSGSNMITPAETTVYTITAENFWGRVTRSAVLTIKPLPITIDFRIYPATLLSGATTTLSWNVSGASSVLIDQGIGQVPAAGSRAISPTATTSYTLKAANEGSSATGSLTVVVNAPISVVFTAVPTAVFAGQGTILQWDVTGATTITIDQGIGDVLANASLGVIPYTNTVYTITASSASSSVSKSVVVTVSEQYPYYPYYYSYPYRFYR